MPTAIPATAATGADNPSRKTPSTPVATPAAVLAISEPSSPATNSTHNSFARFVSPRASAAFASCDTDIAARRVKPQPITGSVFFALFPKLESFPQTEEETGIPKVLEMPSIASFALSKSNWLLLLSSLFKPLSSPISIHLWINLIFSVSAKAVR